MPDIESIILFIMIPSLFLLGCAVFALIFEKYENVADRILLRTYLLDELPEDDEEEEADVSKRHALTLYKL